MAIFDEVRFPTGITYTSKGGPGWSTIRVENSSGFVSTNQNWADPLRRWDISTGLKNNQTYQQVLAFFHARAGGARPFRFKDWWDFTTYQSSATLFPPGASNPMPCLNTVAGGSLGDGNTRIFQLQVVYPDAVNPYTRTIKKPVNNGTWENPSVPPAAGLYTPVPVTVYLGGTRVSSNTFTLDYTTGLITFSNAPGTVPVTADFEWDTPALFETDQLPTDYTNFNTLEAKSVMIMEYKL